MYFQGFPSGKTHLTPLPEAFFTDLLPKIQSLPELKVILAAFHLVSSREGNFRYLEESDFKSAPGLLDGLHAEPVQAAQILTEAIRLCVRQGVLLEVVLNEETRLRPIFFLNTARGRAAADSARSGRWSPPAQAEGAPVHLEKTNIFRLYEENIGPLTPLLADMLREAEGLYPAAWIEQAFQIAVGRNVRNWRYVEAILRGWQERGHDESQPRGDTETDRREYVEGKYADFIKH